MNRCVTGYVDGQVQKILPHLSRGLVPFPLPLSADSSCAFLAPVLGSAVSPWNPDFFSHYKAFTKIGFLKGEKVKLMEVLHSFSHPTE